MLLENTYGKHIIKLSFLINKVVNKLFFNEFDPSLGLTLIRRMTHASYM